MSKEAMKYPEEDGPTKKFRYESIRERQTEFYEARKEYGLEILKYLFLTNSGGAIAVLAFIGTQQNRTAPGAIGALILFSTGLLLLGIARICYFFSLNLTFLSYVDLSEKYFKGEIFLEELVDDNDKRTKWKFWEFALPGLSFLCLVLGSIVGGCSLWFKNSETSVSSDLAIFKAPEFSRVSGFSPDSATDWIQVVIQGITLIGLFISGYFAYRAFKSAEKQNAALAEQLKLQQKEFHIEQESRHEASRPYFIFTSTMNVSSSGICSICISNGGGSVRDLSIKVVGGAEGKIKPSDFFERDKGGEILLSLSEEEIKGEKLTRYEIFYTTETGRRGKFLFEGRPDLPRSLGQSWI